MGSPGGSESRVLVDLPVSDVYYIITKFFEALPHHPSCPPKPLVERTFFWRRKGSRYSLSFVVHTNTHLSLLLFPQHKFPHKGITQTAKMAPANLPSVFNATSQDIEMLLAAQSHIGSKNLQVHMAPYLWKTRQDGVNVINVGKTWYVYY